MKLKYLGKQKRDGSYPSVQVGKDFVKIVDGFVEVSDADAVKLIASKNFAATGRAPAAPTPTPEEIAAAKAAEELAEKQRKEAEEQAAKDAAGEPLPGFTTEEWNELTAEERAGLKAAAALAATPDPVERDPNKPAEAAPEAQPAETPAAPAAEPAKAADPAPAADDKAALLARAKELGVPANASWGIPSLKKAIAKAEAK